MKYGRILFNYGAYSQDCFAGYNLGDPVQAFGIKYLYEQMNIPQEEIIDVNLCELHSYNGEYVLLPLIGVSIGTGKLGKIPFSSKIIPLFISSHINTQNMSESQISYLRAYAPIGCRDEYTLLQMKKLSIPAYLSGCITMIFPRKALLPKDGTIFLVDTPPKLFQYIPESLKPRCKEISHLLPLKKKEMSEENAKQLEQKALAQLEIYCKEASLVVGSRLHALAPCIAFGIPVIAATQNCSVRFSFIDKYIPVHTPETFSEIDWNPQPVFYENEKAMFTRLFIEKVRQSYDRFSLECQVSDFYEHRTKSLYNSRYIYKVRNLHGRLPDDFSYIIWGCGLIGEGVYAAISQEFPHANLIAAIDMYKDGTFHNIPIIQPKDLALYKATRSVIFITNYSGRAIGFQVMEQMGYTENKDFFYMGTQNG